MADTKPGHQGGGFLIQSPAAADVFTPEDFGEEAAMIAETTAGFVEQEVLPVLEALERQEHEHSVRLLRRAGELGILGADVPETYGGLGLDKTTTTWITEAMGPSASFGVTYGAHVGIGTLPIVFFGTTAQKEKYLPALATGEKIAAYALTEPDAGSDAMGAKTTATLSPDGTHYQLSGQKQWISNGGFADVFIVYAKIDGEKFTAFIVERDFPGVSVGPEVKKMGLQGSSTCALILQEAQVPVDNVLGEIGRGHIIAFNILNIGRWKLGAGVIGSCKTLLTISTAYAQQRRQFDKPIADFPLIQQKLAVMAVRIYALESMVYRTAGLFDESMGDLDMASEKAGPQAAKAIGEYAVEASINKVFGSEVLDFTVDESVQIHGGYGYMREYAVERAYRDARINRIFEGTNEINRLLIPATLLRRTMKGELPLMDAIQKLQQELLNLQPNLGSAETHDVPLAAERGLVDNARKICLMVAGLGAQKYMQQAEEEQEFLAAVADLVIEVYAMQSSLLRAEKTQNRHQDAAREGSAGQGGGSQAATIRGDASQGGAAAQQDMAQAYIHEGFDRVEGIARSALAALEEGDNLRNQLMILRRLTKRDPLNRVALGRRIAGRVREAGGYTSR